MHTEGFINGIVDFFVKFATDQLMPLMLTVFVVGVILRLTLYYTIRREDWFTAEFAKRVSKYLDDQMEKSSLVSFYNVSQHLLTKTYYEVFEIRLIMKRRKPDMIMTLTDRIFMVEQGCARLVKDSLSQLKHLKFGGPHPKFLEISKSVFHKNGSFNKVFGVVSSTLVNDVLAILPGLFIIAGILGTFLGIMKALPELGAMDISNVEASQKVMDTFLLKMSFSMSTSILGIILSAVTSVLNTVFSAEKVFVNAVERFENNLDLLWNHSDNNDSLAQKEDQEYDDMTMGAVDRRLFSLNDKKKEKELDEKSHQVDQDPPPLEEKAG